MSTKTLHKILNFVSNVVIYFPGYIVIWLLSYIKKIQDVDSFMRSAFYLSMIHHITAMVIHTIYGHNGINILLSLIIFVSYIYHDESWLENKALQRI